MYHKLIITLLLFCSITFGQSGKSVLTNAQKDSIGAIIADSNFYKQSTNIYEVGSDRDYTTISSAITASNSGDVIEIYAGTYSGFTCKDGVNIIGKDKVIITSAITVSSGSTVSIKNLTVTKIINSGSLTLQNVDLNASTGLYLDMDGGVLTANNVNCIGTTTTRPSIDINTGSVKWQASKIIGRLLIDSANVSLTVLDTMRTYQTGGNYQVRTTGNAVLNLNIGVVPMEYTYIWNAQDDSKVFLTAKDFQTRFMVEDNATVTIKNTTATKGHCWLNVVGTGATINVYNSYFYLDVADTTTGLHNIESTNGGNFYAYNSTFYFSGREGLYNTGGSTIAFGGGATSNFIAENCSFIDGGDRDGWYPQVIAFGYYSKFKINNCIVEHRGASSDNVESVIRISDTDSYNLNGRITNTTIKTNSGSGIGVYQSTTRPQTTDTLIIDNVTFETQSSDNFFVVNRASSIDSARIDYYLLNKNLGNTKSYNSEDMFYYGDIDSWGDAKIGTNYGYPSRFTRSGGNIIAGSIWVDGLGRHDGSTDTTKNIDLVTPSLFTSLTGLSNGDSVTVTITYKQIGSNKNLFYSSDMLLFYSYVNDQRFTSQYDVKLRSWGDATDYYYNVVRNKSDGGVTNPAAASIVVSSCNQSYFSFEVPILYGTSIMGLYIQAFNNLNIESITMVKH